MTFRKERYPENWTELRASILARAHQGCECTGQCGHEHPGGRCFATHGDVILRAPRARHLWRQHTHGTVCTGEDCGAVQVVLTVAHLDHVESNNDPENLRAMCQFCHLSLDREDNLRRAAVARSQRVAAACHSAGQTLLALDTEVSHG